MTGSSPDGTGIWLDAVSAALLVAVDAAALGGVRLRARVGPVRDRWLGILRRACGDRPMPRLPPHAAADRLAGGLDLAATLAAGRPVAERGLLLEADGGVLLIPMSERLPPELAAVVGAAMDTGTVQRALRLDGSALDSSRFGVVALDEGVEPDERTPAGLADRLGLHVDLGGVTVGDLTDPAVDAAVLDEARRGLPRVRAADDIVEALGAASLALGIASLRGPWLALRAARALAALDGRREVAENDVAAAVRLVLAPRATRLPAAGDDEQPDDEAGGDEDARSEPDDAPDSGGEDGREGPPSEGDEEADADDGAGSLAERVLQAARAAIPAGLLDATRTGSPAGTRRGGSGKSGASRRSGARGRPTGVRRGRLGPNARLDLVETLRAAAPWQKLRAAEAGAGGAESRILVRPDDVRIRRYKQRRETTTVFVVDASGSAALHRLAEAKGAVELLLADCYIRRDRVALVAFRGTRADVLLPPTRSLVQAKRRLAELPGGGGTPLAAGLHAAMELCDGVLHHGATPIMVVLTDGRANIGLDGAAGREHAHRDALAAARRLRGAGLTVLLIDTSPRPRAAAEELAGAMGARYLPLPHADAAHLSAAVRAQSR